MIRILALMMVLATPVFAQSATKGTGAILRALDKTTGQVDDLEIGNGTNQSYGRITVKLMECRYRGNRRNAYAFVKITEQGVTDPVFSGWLIAESPAINAMEHPRYDVWALRCNS